ncbi:hypothetical protein NHX12_023511 [Muraenolepis orangiensis]|uniref:Uncharacterized protein n=1 Tax=Muraenolepis orangiensis TaxID=630683 RepID=A0A9Q0ISU9_9TELE|nr:hypothetical protein NHX12_023511 [Muraenolepis orangiensis]
MSGKTASPAKRCLSHEQQLDTTNFHSFDGPREGAGETGEGTNDASQQAKTVLGYRSAGAVYSSSFAPLSPRPVAGLGRGQGRQANGDREREHGTECQL